MVPRNLDVRDTVKLNSLGAKMLSAVLVVVWCTFSADADSRIYRVDRQDFSSPAPVVRSLGYQNLVNGRPGVYKVNRQDFAGNAPFSQNAGPPFGDTYGSYYPPQKVLYTYERVDNGYQPSASTFQPPRLFVPAESGYQDEAANGQPNYKDVLSLSEYNRRFETVPSYSQPLVPSYSQPSVPSYFQPPVQYQTTSPSYFQRPVQQTLVQSPFQPPVQPSVQAYSQPPALPYSQPTVTPYWMVGSTFPTTRLPPTATPFTTPFPTTIPPSIVTYSPLPQVPAVNEDDGILPPIPANGEENKPLPPVSAQESLRKVFVTEDAVGNRHTKVKYHSFDDFVEVSDEHRELLESFGSIQNNESDFSELPEASPIRRRRNATHSQVFSVFSVRDSQLKGAPAAMRDPEQLLGSYVNRLWQQIEILNDMRKAVREAKLQQQSAKSSPRTIVAADDSTVIVFNGNENFEGKLGDQMSQQESAENLPRPSVPLVQSTSKDESNTLEDLLPSSKETNPWVEQTTESAVTDATTVDANLSDGSHEVLLQRDEGAPPKSGTGDQIIYLTEEPLNFAPRNSVESWEDSE